MDEFDGIRLGLDQGKLSIQLMRGEEILGDYRMEIKHALRLYRELGILLEEMFKPDAMKRIGRGESR